MANDQPFKPNAVLLATILGSSMATIDSTVVNIALPTLQHSLDATLADVMWVVESYTLFLSALLLVGGALGDRYGRRRIFLVGVFLFAVASAACGISANITQLVIARALQGIGGALLVPGSLAIITASFSEGERGKAIGTWSALAAITTAGGPLLGGWILENASWHWIFLINIPIAILVVIVTLRGVPESHDRDVTGRLDWLGGGLATIGLGGLVYAVVESPNVGFLTPLILGVAGIALVALVLFGLVERRASSPMVPTLLFKSRTFLGANLLTLFLYAALIGAIFFLPFNLIQVRGYKPTEAGASLLPFVAMLFLFSRAAGRLSDRLDPRMMLTAGPVVVAIAYFLFTRIEPHGTYWTTFFIPIIVLGIGMAITVAPLTTTVMNAASQRHAGAASGINNAVTRIAGLLSIAVFGVVAVATFNTHLDDDLDRMHASTALRVALQGERVKLAAAAVPTNLDADISQELRGALNDSFLAAFNRVMYLAAVLSLLGATTAALLISPHEHLTQAETFRNDSSAASPGT